MHGVFEALGDPVRRLILELLAAGTSRQVRSSRHCSPGFRSRSLPVSQHLKVLREANLVSVRAMRTRRIYALDQAGLGAAQAWLARLADPLGPFTQPPGALATELARGRRAAHPGQPRVPRPGDQGSQIA